MDALSLRFVDADLEQRFLKWVGPSKALFLVALAVQATLLVVATAASPHIVHLTSVVATGRGFRMLTRMLLHGMPAWWQPWGDVILHQVTLVFHFFVALPLFITGERARTP